MSYYLGIYSLGYEVESSIMSQIGDKKVRRDGNVRYYKGKHFTNGER